MPRAKPFDKKTSTTYALVSRPQNDPLIHSDAPSQIFTEIGPSARGPRSKKVRQRGDLEEEFGFSSAIRANEGEAAEHGVFYDDSSYDYMQHMRDLGGSGNATWIEAKTAKGKEKGRMSLEEALRGSSLEDDGRSVGGNSTNRSIVSSSGVLKKERSVIEQQQDVPDELAGLQLGMDPRLKEVMEALEDEAYVDDEEAMFAQLTWDGEEMDTEDWEDTLYNDEDDDPGWHSDQTYKPAKEYRDNNNNPEPLSPLPVNPSEQLYSDDLDAPIDLAIPAPPTSTQHLFEDLTRPITSNSPKPTLPKAARPIGAAPSTFSSASQFTNKKKRKGALTSNSGFSMTSSALARTESLSVLDSRFDKIAESYMEDGDDGDVEDGGSIASGMSKASRASRASAWGGSQTSGAPQLMPAAFDSVLDDFIGGAEGQAKGRLMRKSGPQGRWEKGQGMKQLDEVRAGLGPARVKGREK